MTDQKIVHVYHHTHWDREWWATFQDYRFRLVDLIDELLDVLDKQEDFLQFLLDGQTIVLNDYLEVRPENRERLLTYIRNGRLQCGPWYILPDEYLVSGEAHIRNLWLGRHTADKLDIPLLPVGYLPDTFGHISQMPQILRGFGLDNAVLWRGTGGSPAERRSEFTWRSPNGSEVLAHWLVHGYFLLPFDRFVQEPNLPSEEAIGKVHSLLQKLQEYSTTNYTLLPYGADHRKIDTSLSEWLSIMNTELQATAIKMEWTAIDQYLNNIKASNPVLQTITGELREHGPDRALILTGVLSARMYIKQLNFYGQLWLERYAEPLSTLSWIIGNAYESAYLWLAWELLIQNHPHDSICGCSIDQVHREMMPRFDQSQQIAERLAYRGAQAFNGQLDLSWLPSNAKGIVVHNGHAWCRSELTRVYMPLESGISPRTHKLVDEEGSEIPFEIKMVEKLRYIEKMRDEQWRHLEIRFVADEVPALGWKAFGLCERAELLEEHQVYYRVKHPVAKYKGSAPVTDMIVGPGYLENEFLIVEVQADSGEIWLTDKRNGNGYKGLNVFENGGDAGDEYTYSKPISDFMIYSHRAARVHVSLEHAGYASGVIRIDLEWLLPDSLTSDRCSRSKVYSKVAFTTWVTLASHSPRVDIRTQWKSEIEDHRLRVRFTLGQPVKVSHAESQFDVIERSTDSLSGNGWEEPEESTKPQQGFVSVHSEKRGLTIANKGLPEFEVSEDGTVYLTLLRAVGWLSRTDLNARIDRAGPGLPTPEAQCKGSFMFDYSIIPHEEDWLKSKAYRDVHNYLAPMLTTPTESSAGVLPSTGGLITLYGDHTLVLSASKKAERSNEWIFRMWNVSKLETSVEIAFAKEPYSVKRVGLNEEDVANGLMVCQENGRYPFSAAGSEIVTWSVLY